MEENSQKGLPYELTGVKVSHMAGRDTVEKVGPRVLAKAMFV